MTYAMHFTTTEFMPYRYKYYYNLLSYQKYNGIKFNLIYIFYIKNM